MKRIERTWAPWETEYLVQHAHREPLESICAHLGRSQDSVKAKAKRLRSYGADIGPLRRCGTVAAICPRCGSVRYFFRPKLGVCAICGEEDIADLTPALPASSRRNRHEAVTRGRVRDPGPCPQDGRGAEEWELGVLARRVRARQKVLERIRGDLSGL